MAESKKATKPQDPKLADGKGTQGKKETGEVSGRGYVIFDCWRCSARNIVDMPADWFVCWNDNALNFTH
jgi:hypothetical protein